MSSKPPILIAGPTAVGKSALAIRLAEKLNGEIVSVDSMQAYRGLDIGTAKPIAEERARIPHHLVDFLELHQSYSAAMFVELGRAKSKEIRGRGRIPIFCGGTGLYFKAMLHGLGDWGEPNQDLRQELERLSIEDCLKEVRLLDPAALDSIDRKNPRRVRRLLEILRQTGKPISQLWTHWDGEKQSEMRAGTEGKISELLFILQRDRKDLNGRIERRVDDMFQKGLVRETEELMKRGLERNRTIMQAIGYRQVVEYLKGERTMAQTMDLVKARTRRLAKHQTTWFKNKLNGIRIDIESEDQAIESVLTYYNTLNKASH